MDMAFPEVAPVPAASKSAAPAFMPPAFAAPEVPAAPYLPLPPVPIGDDEQTAPVSPVERPTRKRHRFLGVLPLSALLEVIAVVLIVAFVLLRLG